MGHSIEGLVARIELLETVSATVPCAQVVFLEQGFGILLNTDKFYDAVNDKCPSLNEEPISTFWKLSPALADLATELSRQGKVAYIETDYFGGQGSQAAIVWHNGQVTFGPEFNDIESVSKSGPISNALYELGVSKGKHADSFEAVGLKHFRTSDAWIETIGENAEPAKPAVHATEIKPGDFGIIAVQLFVLLGSSLPLNPWHADPRPQFFNIALLAYFAAVLSLNVRARKRHFTRWERASVLFSAVPIYIVTVWLTMMIWKWKYPMLNL